MGINEEIRKYALLFDGIKELGNNESWEKVYFRELGMTFTELMQTVGWQNNQAWCAYFAELVWKLGYSQYDSSKIGLLDSLFSASSVQTWLNFGESDFECSQSPVVGSLVIWRTFKDGKPLMSGHTGIVISHTQTVFKTIEGNSANQVRKRYYDLKFEKKFNGLGLLGFVNPML
jgi:hypothetical protein